MDRARWGRLSGVGTSWTLLAASVLVFASSLSRDQGGARGRGQVAACADEGGDTASTLRRSGLGCTGVSAKCDTCERRRQLGVRVWEAGTCLHVCMCEDGAQAVATWRRTVSAARRSACGWRGAACSRAGVTAERRGGLGRHLGETGVRGDSSTLEPLGDAPSRFALSFLC